MAYIDTGLLMRVLDNRVAFTGRREKKKEEDERAYPSEALSAGRGPNRLSTS